MLCSGYCSKYCALFARSEPKICSNCINVLEIDMMVSLTFKTRVGSRWIPSVSTSGSTVTSVNLYIPNLVIFANIFIAVL